MFETVLQRLKLFSKEFARHQREIYLVGGAVRNLLLGRPVKDYDFTTNALPSEVQTYFKRVLPTGLQHGTVTVLFQGEPFEVTTFRVDGGYSDGRRPDAVAFTPSLLEDLSRRDFTINAIALNLSDGTLTDPHGGQVDLAQRTLRAIGNPQQRFDEDGLRLLRLFRFASQLDFSIDSDTLAAVPSRRANLASVSRERIREELVKALAGPSPARAWQPLQEMGFLGDLFAPLTPLPLTSPSLDRLAQVSPELRLAYWMTLACGSDLASWERVLKGLTFTNAEQNMVLGLARTWAVLDQGLPVTTGAKVVFDAWGARSRIAAGFEYLTALEAVGYWKDTSGLLTEMERIQQSGEPVYLADLAIGGKELLEGGILPGPRVGTVLKELQKLVWADPTLNTSEALKNRTQEFR
jgi:tRNA nucleotidyltransferase/poly(A) polymerase